MDEGITGGPAVLSPSGDPVMFSSLIDASFSHSCIGSVASRLSIRCNGVYCVEACTEVRHENNKYFELKKLVGRRGAPELELLAVVIVLFAPILHESLTNSNFVTNTI